MKVRSGFISNSSNASFIISLIHLSEIQVRMIRNHAMACKIVGVDPPRNQNDVWSIYVNELDDYIKGSTGMDNFDMWSFLKAIRVPKEVIKWTGN